MSRVLERRDRQSRLPRRNRTERRKVSSARHRARRISKDELSRNSWSIRYPADRIPMEYARDLDGHRRGSVLPGQDAQEMAVTDTRMERSNPKNRQWSHQHLRARNGDRRRTSDG